MLACFWVANLAAQSPSFIYYSSGKKINDVAIDGQYVWAATNSGLVQYDTLTKTSTFYNRGNSGLPINGIHSIAIGTDGTRWLGTRIGLIRWQGNSFVVLNPASSQLNISRVRIDSIGDIWMHTSSHYTSLRRFDGQNWTSYNDEDLFGGMHELDASPAAAGVWVKGDTFYYFDGNIAVSHPFPPDMGNPPGPSTVYDWCLDANGKVWFQIGNLLGIPVGDTWEMEEMESLPIAIAISPNGLLWTLDSYDGVYVRHTDGTWEHVLDSHVHFSGFEFQLLATEHGDLWLGTEEVGLHHFGSGVFSAIQTSIAEIPEHAVVKLEITENQTVWAIFDDTYSQGWGNAGRLLKFRDGAWQEITETAPGASIGNCVGMAIDGLDRLWVVANSVIYRYDGQWQLIPNPPGFLWDWVFAVSSDPNTNNVWFGGIGKIARYNGADFQVFDAPFPQNRVEELTVDQQGNVWMAFLTNEGYHFARFDGQNWAVFTTADLGFSDYIGPLCEIAAAPNGDVWVITPNQISRFDGNGWQKIALEGFQYGGFNTIAFDGSEKVWIGCYNSSCFSVSTDVHLIQINGNDIYSYPYKTTPFLPYPNITALAVDANHNLWIGGQESGIAVFNENGVVLGTNDLPSAKGYSILPAKAFPNPTSNASVIEYTLEATSDVLLELRSISGQLIQSKNLLNQLSGNYKWDLNINSLAQGSYCWRILSEKSVANGTIVVKGHR